MIIGITGLISSGKDTVADYLCTFHGFKRISFAGTLKDAVASVFGWDRELLEGSTKTSREWREEIDAWWADRLAIPHLTPRWVLQYWGTEVCRNAFHNDIWVASVENKLRNTKDDIVITDCRFANEVHAIKKVGGITMRIERGLQPEWYDAAVAFNKGDRANMKWAISRAHLERSNVHASEYSSVGLVYDHYIDNNGTVSELHSQIAKIILQSYKNHRAFISNQLVNLHVSK